MTQMAEISRSRIAELNQANAVSESAPLDVAIDANQTRAEMAREFAKDALASIDPNTITAENLIASGARVVGERIVGGLLKLVGGVDETQSEQPNEENSRIASVGARAREEAQGELVGLVNTQESSRVAELASGVAERERFPRLALEEARVSELGAAADTDPDTLSMPRLFGGRVERYILASSDFPLAYMDGPGFEFLAADPALGNTESLTVTVSGVRSDILSLDSNREQSALASLTGPSAYDRATGLFDTRIGDGVTTSPAIAYNIPQPSVDNYAVADLSSLYLQTSQLGTPLPLVPVEFGERSIAA